MKIRKLQAILICFLLLLPAIIYGCQCEHATYDETYYLNLLQSSSATIFSGRVIKKVEIAGQQRWEITFKVFENWKNADKTEITITTKIEGCGYYFSKWRSYFVVGSKYGDQVYVGLCSATGSLGRSKKHIESLNKSVARKNSLTLTPLNELQNY
jgi:hypothetical protein